mmetsp:Transcript_48323/g.102782  ORF Transcript_48323/g.102782 Transcript_48323/m.102782 type:complete len:80 (-) Transcript_48323:1534-1773(-)
MLTAVAAERPLPLCGRKNVRPRRDREMRNHRSRPNTRRRKEEAATTKKTYIAAENEAAEAAAVASVVTSPLRRRGLSGV